MFKYNNEHQPLGAYSVVQKYLLSFHWSLIYQWYKEGPVLMLMKWYGSEER